MKLPPADFHADPQPLYKQVEGILRGRIRKGEWASDRRLPSEDELAAQFQVSKITVRHALARLADQRLVARRPGRGTFVIGAADLVEPPPLLGALDDLSTVGRTTLKLLQWGVEAAEADVLQALGLKRGAKVMASRRLRSDAKGPISFVETYFPADLVKRLPGKQVAEAIVLALLEHKLGLVVGEAKQSTTAAAAHTGIAGQLGVAAGSPVLLVKRVYFGLDQRPLCAMVVSFRGDRYRYTATYRRP